MNKNATNKTKRVHQLTFESLKKLINEDIADNNKTKGGEINPRLYFVLAKQDTESHGEQLPNLIAVSVFISSLSTTVVLAN